MQIREVLTIHGGWEIRECLLLWLEHKSKSISDVYIRSIYVAARAMINDRAVEINARNATQSNP